MMNFQEAMEKYKLQLWWLKVPVHYVDVAVQFKQLWLHGKHKLLLMKYPAPHDSTQ
jgi:hypothetical protein